MTMILSYLRRKPDWLAMLFILLCVTVFHWRGLQPGYAFLPIDNVNNNRPWREGPFVLGDLQNQLIGDPIYQYYPFLVYSIEAVHHGEWPVWNSRILLGHPSVGDPLAQTFYPVFLGLGLMVGAARGLTLGFVAHALIAGLLTYAWLRALNRTPAAATLGAIIYALSGYMVTWFETTFWVGTLAWLPGVLWMFERAFQLKQARYVILAGVLLGVAILAGQVSFIVLFCLFLGIYAAGRVIETQPSDRRLWGWASLTTALTVGLGAAIGAVQILPFVEVLQESHRTTGAPFGSVPLEQIITFIVPDFYGNPSTTGAYWGAGNFSEGVMYLGVAAILLGLSIAFQARPHRRLGWLALAIMITYFSYGGPGMEVVSHLPILRYLTPSRSVFLLPLIGAGLAAETIDADFYSWWRASLSGLALVAAIAWSLYDNWGSARLHWLEISTPIGRAVLWIALSAALLTFRHWAPRWRSPLNWAFVGLTFVDLYTFGHRYNPALPLGQLPQPTPVVEFLQANAGSYRTASRQVNGDIVFGPNYLTVFGVPDLNGYLSLLPARLVKLVKADEPETIGYNGNTIWLESPSPRLLDLLQARFVVSTSPQDAAEIMAEHTAQGCQTATPEISASQPITGALIIQAAAINRLDLAFRLSEPPQPPPAVMVRMWQGLDQSRLVLESPLDATQLKDGQNSTFYFALEEDAPGQTYSWEISSPAEHTGLSVCADALGQPEFSVYGVDQAEVYQGELYVTERFAALPRAYVVYASETIREDDAAIARLLDPAFDIRNVAVTAVPTGLPVQAAHPATRSAIMEYRATKVVVAVQAQQEGLLVLGDYAFPGWVAYVDGQRAQVVRANLLWRGVRLTTGDHIVVFQFEPASLKVGLGISAAALTVVCLLVSVRLASPQR